jgi:hypothetical protein
LLGKAFESSQFASDAGMQCAIALIKESKGCGGIRCDVTTCRRTAVFFEEPGRKSCQEKQTKTSVPNVPRQGDAKVTSQEKDMPRESYFHRDFKKGDVKRKGCQEDETLRFRAAKEKMSKR